jgi:hypothetical protein
MRTKEHPQKQLQSNRKNSSVSTKTEKFKSRKFVCQKFHKKKIVRKKRVKQTKVNNNFSVVSILDDLKI